MSFADRHLEKSNADGTPVEASAPEYARLLVQNQFGALATKDVLRPTTLIGGQPGCNIHLVSPEIAPAHCVLTREADGFHIRNLRNAAGTRVNDVVVETSPLRDGDEVHLGPFVCRLETNVSSTPLSTGDASHATRELSSPISAGTATLVVRNREGATVRKVLSRHTTLIGTMPQANVQLAAPEISPAHCIVTREADGLRVRDLRSRNGTRVNGATFEVRHLRNGDVLEVGPFVCLIETDIESTPDDSSDKFDRRFHLDVDQPHSNERALIVAEREHLSTALAGIETARTELDEARAVLDRDRLELERERAALNAARSELDQLRSELSRERGELDQLCDEHLRRQEEEAEAHAREKQKLFDSQADFASQSDSLAALRAELDKSVADLERKQKRLAHDCAKFQTQLQQLDADRGQYTSTIEKCRKDREQLNADAARLQAERVEFDTLREELDTESTSLMQARTDFDKLKKKLDGDILKFQRAESELVEKLAALDSDQASHQEQVRAHELERQHLREESDRSRAAADQLTNELANLEQQKTHLVSQMQLFAFDTDALRSDQARLNAAFESLAEERKTTELNRQQMAARQSEIDLEHQRINELREVLAKDAERIKSEQKVIADDRSRLSSELREVAKILAQLRTDREAHLEDEQRLRDEQSTLSAANARLEQQQAAIKRAVADLDDRNEDLLARRERLKAEQAYLRSGKRQFQGALDEFRAEQIRFRHAVASVKSHRKALSRRREARAELHSIRAAHWAIPLGSEWIIDRELEGLTIDDGTLLGYVDSGETGRVYVIEDRRTNRRVAVKFESPSPDDSMRTDQVETAWRSTLDIRHANVVRSLNVDRRNGVVRLFMEYVEAINLRELIDLHGSLPWREVASYGFQTALALESLHAAECIHGAVIPSHLMIESAGMLRLLNSNRGDSNLTRIGLLPAGGKVPEIINYAAPEQLRENGKIDARSDLYQLGCVMYHALSGQVPFPVPTLAEKIEHHATKIPLPIRRAGQETPKDLILVIKKLMAKQPLDRFRTAEEAVHALAPFARQLPAWFSFESVLASRAAMASHWKPAPPVENNSPVPAPTPAEMEG